MDKDKNTQVFVLSVNELGQKVYTSQSDPTRRYFNSCYISQLFPTLNSFSFIIDDDGNVSDYDSSVSSNIKMESAQHDMNENSNDGILADNSIVAHLDDPSHLGN